jgi:hypothetical protein
VHLWQPYFYFYLDAFIGATRSIPDIIQKCFGIDAHSAKDWPQPLTDEEKDRRKVFQDAFSPYYRTFHRQPLSRVRIGTFHWLGIPSVQTEAKGVDGRQYTGDPRTPILSAASREFPAGTDPTLVVLFSQPLPIEPSWEKFTLKIPQADETIAYLPLFPECEEYASAAHQLVQEARVLYEQRHKGAKLTSPLAVARAPQS